MPARRSKRQRATSTPGSAQAVAAPGNDTSLSSQHSTDDLDECCICITTPVLPVKLPCGHKFCYLCAKGSAAQNHLCPLCRAKVPDNFFTRPKLLLGKRTKSTEITTSNDASSALTTDCSLSALSVDDITGDHSAAAPKSVYPAWQYQGRGGGWWLYEERHRAPIEEAYANKVGCIELLIAGFIYIINFAEMKQFRKDLVHVTRNIRRVEQPALANSSASDYAASQNGANGNLLPLQDVDVKGVAGVLKKLLLPKDSNVTILPATLPAGSSGNAALNGRGRKRKA